MKRYSYILAGLFLTCGALNADDNAEDYTDIETYNVDTSDMSQQALIRYNESKGPFRANATFDWIQRAKIDKDGYHHDHVDFYEWDVDGNLVVYYNECVEEGILIGASFDSVRFKWKENPYFHRTIFNEVSLSVSAFTKRFCGWLWQGQVQGNYDTKHHNWSEYSNYDITLWGRYDLCENIRIHTGFIAKTGMKIDRIFPILGFDWAFCECWKLNLVFPVNVSLVYQWDENWTAAIAARVWDVRRRVGKNEPLPQALLEYRNKGLELMLGYQNHWLEANIHGGYTFGGYFKISNKNHRHQHNFDFDASAYAGGEVVLKF